MRLISAQNLRTIQPQQKNKVSIKVVNKAAAIAAQLAKCILLQLIHVRTTASCQLREHKQKLHIAV